MDDRMIGRGRRLRDDRGNVMVEFLIWVPVLAFWLVASLVFFDGFKSRNEAAKASYTVSDIISRDTEISSADFAEFAALLDALTPSRDGANMMRITSIRFQNEAYTVLWSRPFGNGVAPMENEDIPVGILPVMGEFDTVVLTETVIPYAPLVGVRAIGIDAWRYSVVTYPRFAAAIGLI